MRFIKLFLISAFFLFLVLAAITSLFPAHLRMSRAIDIQASRENIFNAINVLGSWKRWNQFIINAPLTNARLSSPDSGRGAYIKSDQLVVSISGSSPDSITTQWNQVKGKNFSGGYNLMELKPGIVTVQSYFDFSFGWYPWEKLSSLLYEREIGTVMEESLSNLKSLTEINK
jgi:hypothetical protein